MTHVEHTDASEWTPLLSGQVSSSPPPPPSRDQVPHQIQPVRDVPWSPVLVSPVHLPPVLALVLPRDSVTSTSSLLYPAPTQPVTPKSGRSWRKSCGFIFLQQAFVILELVSLIFYVTLFLYSFGDSHIVQRNKSAFALVAYILIVMIYSLYSLQLDFPILLKILASVVKLFISSLFFAFSLEHIILLPAFFFYFFPTVAGICIHFLLI